MTLGLASNTRRILAFLLFTGKQKQAPKKGLFCLILICAGDPPKFLLMHYVYILLSRKDDKLYVGYTIDLVSRISKHNAGKVLATKARLPLRLVYYEAHLDERGAREREKYLKTGWGRNFILKNCFLSIKVCLPQYSQAVVQFLKILCRFDFYILSRSHLSLQ